MYKVDDTIAIGSKHLTSPIGKFLKSDTKVERGRTLTATKVQGRANAREQSWAKFSQTSISPEVQLLLGRTESTR